LATSVTHLTAFFLDHLGKTVHCTGLDFNEARDDGVALASAGPYTNLYTSLQTDITMPAPLHFIFTGRMLFLTPSQQRQSTEG